MAKDLTALGGGIFAGLFTVGVKRAGFRVVAHVEQDNYGVKTCELNHPELKGKIFFPKDRWPTSSKPIDLMFCNPACAAWSAAGSGNKGLNAWRHDPRIHQTTDLVEYALDVVKPRAFITESVINAWRHGREFFTDIAHRFANAGYNVTIVLQNNAYIGAPQFRQRMFFVAHKHGLFGYGLDPDLRDDKDVPSVGAVLREVKLSKKDKAPLMLNDRYYPLWERSSSHKGMLRKTYELMERDIQETVVKPVAIMRRLRAAEIAPVIYGYRKHMHPTEPRWLHINEYLALFGLYERWTMWGSMSAATMELGRSVLPDAGRWIAEAVKRGFEQRPRKVKDFTLLDLRDPNCINQERLW